MKLLLYMFNRFQYSFNHFLLNKQNTESGSL